MLGNLFKTKKQAANHNYQHSHKGRLAIFRQYQMKLNEKNGFGYALRKGDNLSFEDVLWLEKENRGYCPCCNKYFKTGINEYQFGHIDPMGYANRDNIQLICRDCNLMQKDMVIDFCWLMNTYRQSFLSLFMFNRDWTIDTFKMTAVQIKRVEKRLQKEREG